MSTQVVTSQPISFISIQFNNSIRFAICAVCAVAGAAAIAMVVERVAQSIFEKRKLDQILNTALTMFIGATLFWTLFPAPADLAPLKLGVAVLGYCLVSRLVIPAFAERLASHPESNELVKPVTFKDIAGNPQAKAAMANFVTYVKLFDQPNSLYKQFGIKPKGFLFYGPPGTGKTLFANALAGETGCPFVSMRASELNEIYVGTGVKAVREYFDRAKNLAKIAKKPCILFIDEVDAIGMKRSYDNGLHPHNTQTLSSLLVRLGSKEYEDVFIIMATNRKEDLDEALIRSGRIDAKIEFQLPNEEERYAILQVHLKDFKFEKNDQFFLAIAQLTADFSGADLENIADQTISSAVRRGDPVTLKSEDFIPPIWEVKKEIKQNLRLKSPRAQQPALSAAAIELLATILRSSSHDQNRDQQEGASEERSTPESTNPQ